MNIIWSNLSTTQNISGLAGGTYTVTVTDAYGCVKTASALVNESPVLLALTAVPTAVTCTGSGDGKVDLTIDGGTGPMNIIWSNLSTTQNISGLSGGTYTVTVTDAYGCVKTASALVNESPVLLALTAVPTAVTCTGSGDGKVDLTIDGGTGPMNIIWSNLSTTQNISGLAGGTYTVTVTDAYGCVKTASALVNDHQFCWP